MHCLDVFTWEGGGKGIPPQGISLDKHVCMQTMTQLHGLHTQQGLLQYAYEMRVNNTSIEQSMIIYMSVNHWTKGKNTYTHPGFYTTTPSPTPTPHPTKSFSSFFILRQYQGNRWNRRQKLSREIFFFCSSTKIKPSSAVWMFDPRLTLAWGHLARYHKTLISYSAKTTHAIDMQQSGAVLEMHCWYKYAKKMEKAIFLQPSQIWRDTINFDVL